MKTETASLTDSTVSIKKSLIENRIERSSNNTFC